MTERFLNWRSRHDPRSKGYGIRPLLQQKEVKAEEKMWDEGIVLDQGSEGACVGFAWAGGLLADPNAPKIQPSFKKANDLARSFYHEAQKIDQWPGEDYSGTSVLAGAKVMKSKGLIKEYRWCFSLSDIKDAVISEGPVVIGIPWYQGMYQTRQDGLVRVSGKKVGGHAILITGYSPKMKFGNKYLEVFRWRNSWGESYGVGGSGWIEASQLNKLIKDNAEACVPMKKSSPVLKRGVAISTKSFQASDLFKNFMKFFSSLFKTK